MDFLEHEHDRGLAEGQAYGAVHRIRPGEKPPACFLPRKADGLKDALLDVKTSGCKYGGAAARVRCR